MTWTFTSSATRPDGLEIEVSITVDPEEYGPDFPEVSEITQMALVKTLSTVQQNDRLKSERFDPADLVARIHEDLDELPGLPSEGVGADTAGEANDLPD